MFPIDYADECAEWLEDCLKVFPKVKRKRIEILCGYRKMTDKMLGRLRWKINTETGIDPEALFLNGVVKLEIKRRIDTTFFLKLNDKLKGIDNNELREQVVKNIIIHELIHIEREDPKELNKNYSRRKRKKVHTGLRKEAFERFNQLREIEGLPRIKDERDLHVAVTKIFERLKNLDLASKK